MYLWHNTFIRMRELSIQIKQPSSKFNQTMLVRWSPVLHAFCESQQHLAGTETTLSKLTSVHPTRAIGTESSESTNK